MSFCYMPILKWKQGEQTTLRELSATDQEKMLPLIELMPFKSLTGETLNQGHQRDAKKTGQLLIKAGFDDQPIAVDTLYRIPSYASQTKLLIATSNQISKSGINKVYPVVHPGMVLSEPAEFIKLQDYEALILRIRVGTFLPIQIDSLITSLREALASPVPRIHVLLDMFDMVGASPTASAAAITPLITAALANDETSSVTVAGGGFPMSLAGIPQGNHSIPRTEYETYLLLRNIDFPDLKFGDYAVTNPIPMEGLDPTKMNPSCQIRYTRLMNWLLIKGQGSKTHGMGQYNQLSQLLVAHKDYSGKTYSFGDERYDYHAQNGSTSGSYMTWRRDATSHHVVFTVRQLRALLGI